MNQEGIRERDIAYLESVHNALMEQGEDISLSHVLSYIEHDAKRPRDYAIYEIKQMKEILASR